MPSQGTSFNAPARGIFRSLDPRIETHDRRIRILTAVVAIGGLGLSSG